MSRVAKNPVDLQGATVNLSEQEIEIKGPKGTLKFVPHPLVKIAIEKNEDGKQNILFSPRKVEKFADAIAGTTRAIINNMVTGVTKGFEITLELVGVGYRAQASGNKLNLSLGFSHPIEVSVPAIIKAETPNNTTLILKGCDKQALGQFAAQIRKYRLPEPYNGKGIKYLGEVLLRKEAKKK